MQDGKAIAFLIHGYIGAGKTTLARQLEVEKAAIRFTQDEWMRCLHGNDPPEDLFAEYASRVSDLMERMWTRCIAVKTNVILDFGFWSRSERDRVRELVATLKGEARLYRLSCPDDIAWRRVEKRNAFLDASLYIAPNTFEILKSRFEPLQPDEDRIEVEANDGSARP
jgi:predicted kinase